MRRWLAFLSLLALFLVLWIFLGSEPWKSKSPRDLPREAAPQTPVDGDTLVIAIAASPDYLNPVISQLADPTFFLFDLLFPSLLGVDFDCGLRFAPALAERWEWGEGRLEATFHLRKDLRWEDGRPATADDVVSTFDLLGDPEVLSPRANHLDRMRKPAPVEKLDEFTVRFHFSEAYDPMVQLSHSAAFWLVPKHGLESADRSRLAADPFNRRPISAGPFRLERWVEGQELVLVPNEASGGRRRTHLDRIVFRVIRDYNTRLTELLSGGVDFVYGLQPEDLQRAAAHPDLRVLPRGYRWIDYVVWNLREPLFQSDEVRRALALAVDCDRLIESTLSVGSKRYGRRAVSNITPEICGAENTALRPYPYDPAEARRILSGEGWIDEDGDGVLEKGGKRFSFALLTYVESPRLLLVSQAIQAMLREVGVEARIDKKEYIRAIDSLSSKQFQAALMGWQAEAWIDPSATLGSGKPFNYGSYSSSEVDRLLDLGPRTADPDRAKEIWDELQRVVYEDQPMLFLYWRDIPSVVHKRFRNVKANILTPFGHLESWWVPLSEQKYRP